MMDTALVLHFVELHAQAQASPSVIVLLPEKASRKLRHFLATQQSLDFKLQSNYNVHSSDLRNSCPPQGKLWIARMCPLDEMPLPLPIHESRIRVVLGFILRGRLEDSW